MAVKILKDKFEEQVKDFLICEDKEQTWFIISASNEEEAVRLHV